MKLLFLVASIVASASSLVDTNPLLKLGDTCTKAKDCISGEAHKEGNDPLLCDPVTAKCALKPECKSNENVDSCICPLHLSKTDWSILSDGTCMDCFPSHAKITRADGTTSRIDELKEGDAIVAATDDGKLTIDTVSLLSIAKPAAAAQYVQLTTASQHNLTLTAGHHLPVGAACCSALKKAGDVSVGETVWTVAPGAASATTITAKALVKGTGLHSPVLTHGGFPIVDGVVTSFDDAQTVSLASYTLKYLLPLCKASGSCALFRRTFLNADRQYIDEA